MSWVFVKRVLNLLVDSTMCLRQMKSNSDSYTSSSILKFSFGCHDTNSLTMSSDQILHFLFFEFTWNGCKKQAHVISREWEQRNFLSEQHSSRTFIICYLVKSIGNYSNSESLRFKTYFFQRKFYSNDIKSWLFGKIHQKQK
jgi:hypothetical protein